MSRATLALALSLLATVAACRERGNTSAPPSTVVPTQVPTQPPAPMPMAPNALADAAVVAAPNALADAAVAQPTAPAEPAPTAPAEPAPAPAEPTAPARPRSGSNDTLNIPSPVNGVPGVRVRRGSNATTVNVGGIRLNLPTQ